MNKGEIFHAKNPNVYELFKKYTLQALATGKFKVLGVSLIWEVMRYYTMLEAGKLLALPNEYRAFYARKFMADHPQHRGVFTTRLSQFDLEVEGLTRTAIERQKHVPKNGFSEQALHRR